MVVVVLEEDATAAFCFLGLRRSKLSCCSVAFAVSNCLFTGSLGCLVSTKSSLVVVDSSVD